MATFDATKNFAKATVSIGYNAVDTSIVLQGGHGDRLPQPSTDGEFNLVWWNNSDYGDPTDDINKEIVRCTARTSDTLTITRAQESTTGTIKNISGKTYRMALTITAKVIDDIIDNFGASSTMTVSQTSHGFAVGDIIKSSGTDGEFAKAQADSEANSNVVGVVTIVTDTDNFVATLSGLVDVAAAVPNVTAGSVLYLDPDTAGAVTTTEPTTEGDVSKPLGVVTTANTEMVFLNPKGEVVVAASGTSSYIENIYKAGTVITKSIIVGNVSSATSDSKTMTLDSVAPLGTISPDGTTWYANTSAGYLYKYSLTTPWDISTGSITSQRLTIYTTAGNPGGICFAYDGSYLYISDFGDDKIYGWALSTPWDVSTAGSLTSYDCSGEDGNPYGIFITPDGTRVFLAAQANDRIYQYDLSTPYIISSASYSSEYISVSGAGTNPTGFYISHNGLRMWVYGGTDGYIYQYTLSTAWDITSASYDSDYLDITVPERNLKALMLGYDDTKLYFQGSSSDEVKQYSMPTTANEYSVVSFPESFNSKDISAVYAYVTSGGTGSSGTTEIDIECRTISGSTPSVWTSVLSTPITIDYTELDSRDATTAPVIDSGESTIASKNQYRINVKEVSAADIEGLGIGIDAS